jgi:cytochrome b subunit of formate dehydrogenase
MKDFINFKILLIFILGITGIVVFGAGLEYFLLEYFKYKMSPFLRKVIDVALLAVMGGMIVLESEKD